MKLARITTLALSTGCTNRGSQVRVQKPTFSAPNVEIRLIGKEVEWELGPGKIITAWTYNGKLPGEMIQVREGDRVQVILENHLPEATTVHWHGIDVPVEMDGVPDISQPPIQPGETFVYQFVAQPAGTRWYHTHTDSTRQMYLGLSAPFLIEPRVPDSPVDRDYTLILDDWITRPPNSDQPPKDGGGMKGG